MCIKRHEILVDTFTEIMQNDADWSRPAGYQIWRESVKIADLEEQNKIITDRINVIVKP